MREWEEMAAGMATVLGGIRGRGAIVALVLAPIIMPAVVVAVATYFLLVRLGLQGTEFGLALGHAVFLTSWESRSPTCATSTLYTSRRPGALARDLATLRTIVAPLVMPAFIVASFFAFLTSFDDVVYVLFLGIGKTVTLPMRMWEGIRQDINPTIAAVAALQMMFAATIIVVGAC
ncbi:hypothetical protein NKI25_34440 [Mesorhizobium sp. M0808]|uniref:ABC transporter permease n=1 Tax=Mesorhizobium sp. M0808 TaxID=2957002 RepID=UPI00333B8244